MHLTSKQWTAIFVAVVVIAVVLFAYSALRPTDDSLLTPEEIRRRMQAVNGHSSLTPEERDSVVRSMTAQPSESSMTVEERERVLQSMMAQPR
ncbi:MAG: hypothetical protein COV07_02755 [Candidatus Vogelbacteria bacterium CG10_big_fil_rev_8_21_14_0_10_45_14]|uniref:Uncharacterized protein n=1 Tax=Candidatus Vogelbacteria bacterium CG10_big_fil_rev_8_21_14_0_10_45_14 TaxID=1975042 RepID=A0A2H0RJZ2_9BACT|nr:MAG: hypothetical protein COV07_02755 [Candidatus Vogelbacteria bacterium CG10_big_fil_rev_8_21_14_0_10_45_14]